MQQDESMLDWMIETGRVVEVHSLYDLTQFDQPWSSLPAEDLVDVIEILVEKEATK
ncbi:MAG: hypothetical protein H7645_07610 [Candidatus Heimdallarchaeota archaeon]|nr:hypothetical protein [Candidatus Heimdallarchaeota archaeon]MCK4770190.1 hypothetical protein [Candidatus Heimdallarchaeota archaeon]